MRIDKLRAALALLVGAAALAPHAAHAQPGGRTVRIGPLYPRWERLNPGVQQPARPDTGGFRFRLSQGTGMETYRATPARWTRLSDDDTRRLLDRLPPLRAVSNPADSFAFPALTLRPPRAGATVETPFPPPDETAPPRSQPTGPVPLSVLRRAPEGEVQLGAEVTVSFSAPMIPLTSVGEAASFGVPVRMSPQVPGAWRWIDVRTAKFEPRGRLPMATEFTVEIPAGTPALNGGRLTEAVRWTFQTPAPTPTGGYPHESPTGLNPIFVVAFDQEINPAAVLRTIRVSANGQAREIRLATKAEIDADEAVKQLVTTQDTGRWVAFRAARPLPTNAEINVRVGPGTPSAEGPRVSDDAGEWSFRTYGPFRFDDGECYDCRPGSVWWLRFTNDIDPRSFRRENVTITPALPEAEMAVSGSAVYIRGRAAPNARYRVRVAPGLRDAFGQTLASAAETTFSIGPPQASLRGPGHRMVVLDPLARPEVSVFSGDHARLRVRVHRVEPADWPAFAGVGRPEGGGTARLPGRLVSDRVVTLDAPPGEERETRVDLVPALEGRPGQLVVAVEAVNGFTPEERRQSVYLWVQSTRIGLSAFADATELLGWATSLVDGAPLPGAALELSASGVAAARTAADGTGTIALPEALPERPYLVARHGGDLALLPRDGDGRGGWARWTRTDRGRGAAWYVVTDRNLYRPGETVRFKGWLRVIDQGEGGSVSLAGNGAGEAVEWEAFDPRRASIARGTSAVTGLGGFDGRFTVPEGTNLGGARISLTYRPRMGPVFGGNAGYVVQEFRRPEYTVTASASEGPHFVRGSAEVTARAAYYAGGPLPGAPVRWQVTATPGRYTPPGWDQWHFGPDRPVWWDWERPDPAAVQTFEGTTDASGAHAVRADFLSVSPPRPYTVHAEGTVTDVNRQTWTAGADLLVHPADVYVGLRTERAWLEEGDTIDFDVVATGLDGKPVAGRSVEVKATLRGWRQDTTGAWTEYTKDAESCAFVSGAEPSRCTFAADESGAWRVVATVRDEAGRPNETVRSIWVSGGRVPMRGPGMAREGQTQVVPDRETYAPGDTARVLVRAPFYPARGLVTLRRSGIVRHQEIEITGPTHTFRVPITDDLIPNVQVQVDLVGAGTPRDGDPQAARGVAFASGGATLEVPPAVRTLKVAALPADSATEPDAETSVEVEVRDAAGRPVRGAEVALVVVDEAVLALSGYRFPDPLAVFYPRRGPDATDLHLRPLVMVTVPDLDPAPGTLVGKVVDARTGTPLGEARVRVEGAPASDAAGTDVHGRFRVRSVARGARTLVVERDGYATARVTVEVGAEAVPALRVSLLPRPPEAREMARDEFSAMGRAGGVAAEGMQALSAPPPPPPPPPAPVAAAPAMRSRADGADAAPQPIAVRTNFDPLAVFAPAERTGDDGRVRVAFKLPSNLTRYRVVAVAVEGATRYGLGESAVTARQPLMVRPSAPRFLNFGDRFELPVVLQNQTGAEMTVDVAARAAGFTLHDAGRRVIVPANDRVEVRIAGEADRAGRAVFQVAAVSGARADAAEGTLPVWTPATSEAFAVYGNLTDGAVELPLQVPADAIPAFGALEVSTSSTALQELTDALLYLVRYPFDCAEQISSRMLAITGLRDVLYAFKAEDMPAPDSLAAFVAADVKGLAERQHGDGGWGFWRSGESWPYVSIHATHALVRAREKGYPVPDNTLDRAMGYLRQVPRNAPAWYPDDVKRALHAYALYVRDRAGDRVQGDVRALVARHGRELKLEEMGWLLSAAAGDAGLRAESDSLRRWITNRATETASTATFATAYTEGEYLLLHSNRRTDGIVLEALLAADSANELVAKTVRGLLGHRVKGRWDNTQENAWVLLALDRYFRAYEGQTPEFVARVWLGDRFAAGHEYSGRTADRKQVTVPMRVLTEDRPASVTIGKEGPGRLYWRAGLRYAPRDLDLTPLQAGFAVDRTYQAVDDSADVVKGEDGRWRVKAGARVRVTVTMTAPSRRLHVAMVDPLPAGFEAVNPDLLGQQDSPPEATRPTARGRRGGMEYGYWWRPWWYEHQNLRDDRAEAFTSLLPAGVYTYSYVARATTPGIFIVPPPRAEEMYSPETFGRGQTDRVIVEMREEASER